MGRNKRWKQAVLWILSYLIGAGLCAACTLSLGPTTLTPTTEKGGNERVELTKRQIEILAQVGLPADYEALTPGQRNDIMAIEEMLCYLEQTYDLRPVYRYFVQGGSANDEALTVEMGGYTVTLSRRYDRTTEEYIYTDDYRAVSSTEEYEQAILAYFAEQALPAKVYAQVSQVAEGDGSILSRANAATYVFLEMDDPEFDLEQTVNDYAQWYLPQLGGIGNVTRFYAVSSMDFLDIGRKTYYDCLQEIPKEKRIICILSADGSVTLA